MVEKNTKIIYFIYFSKGYQIKSVIDDVMQVSIESYNFAFRTIKTE